MLDTSRDGHAREDAVEAQGLGPGKTGKLQTAGDQNGLQALEDVHYQPVSHERQGHGHERDCRCAEGGNDGVAKDGWPVFFSAPEKEKGQQRKKGRAGFSCHKACHSHQDRHWTSLVVPDPYNEKNCENADALLHQLGKGRDLHLFLSVVPAA